MAAGDGTLSFIINIAAIDGASAIVGNVANAVKQLTGSGVLGTIAAGATAAGAALVTMGVNAAQAAGAYQESLTQLVTGAGEAQSNIKAVGDGILQMSVDTATSTKQLTDGMYMIESAGYRGAQGLDVLKAAAEGAKVGNADLGTVSQALTGVLVNYHLPASDAVAVTNALIKTVGDGQMHMQDLASSMGNVLPVAAALGVSFPQVAGAIAVMTNHQMDARRATMDLSNTLRSLAAPNATAQKSMQAVGLTAQQLKDTLSTQGLAGAIQLIEEHVGKTFPAGSVQAVQAFKNIMGGATGYTVALMLGGKNMKDYQSNIKDVTDALNGGNGAITGWDAVQEDFNFKVSRAQQALSVLMITLGQQLLPVFGKVVDWVTQVVTGFTQWESQTHFVENALNVVVGALGLLGQGLGQVMSVLGQLWGLVEPFFGDLTKAAGTWGQNFMSGFAQGIMAVAADVVHAVEQVAQEIADYLGFSSPSKKGPGSKLGQWGKGMISGLVAGITSSIPLVTSAVTQVAGTLAGVANPAAPGVTGIPAASTSSMVDKLTGDTRKVTVTPEVTQASSAVKQGSATLTSTLSTGITSGAGAVKSAINTVGQHIQALCHTHAQATSTCAADHLTKHLATKMTANAHHVATAAHHVGAQTKHVATHAATHAATAAHHLTHGLASKTKASTPAVAGAVSSLANDVAKGLEPIKKTADNAANAFKPVSAAASQAANAVKQAWAGVTGFFGQIGSALAATWKAMLPGLQSIWQTIQTQLLPAVKNLWDAVKPLVVGIGQLAAAVAQGVAAFAKWLVQSGALKAMWDGFVAGIKIAVTTISVIINAISAALAPVIKQLISTFNTQLKPAFTDLGAALKQSAPFFTALAQVIGGVLLVVLGLLLGILRGVLQAVSALLVGLVKVLGGIGQMLSGVVQIVLGFINFIHDLFTGQWGKLKDDLGVILKGMADLWDGFKNVVEGIVMGLFNAIVGFAQGLWQGLMDWWTKIWDDLVGHSIIPDLVNAIITLFESLFTKIIDSVKRIYNGLVSTWKTIQTAAATIWNTIVTAIETAINKLPTWLSNFFTGLITNFKTWATNAIKGFADAITNGVHFVTDAVSSVGTAIKNFLGFHSPPASGPLAQSGTWMPNMMTMLGQGITQNTNKVTTPITTMGQNINQQFTKLDQQVGTNVSQINGKINTLGSNFQTVGQNVRTSMSLLGSQIQLSAATINNSLTSIGTQSQQTRDQVKQASNSLGVAVTTSSNVVVQANQIIDRSNQQTAQNASTAQAHFTQSAKQMQDASKQTATVVSQSAKDAQKSWDDAIQHGTTSFKDFARSLKELFQGDIIKSFNDFRNGIAELGKSIVANAQSIASQVAAILGHSKPTAGPLKDDDLWGKHFVENLVSGMQAGMPALNAVTNQLANKLALAYPTAQQGNTFALSSNSTSSQVPQQVNLSVNLDGKAIMKQMGIRMAHEIRVQGNIRGI